jgi:hypothetical protein
MQRLCAVNSLRQDRQAATAAAQCRVIGDGDVDLEHLGNRSERTLGLSQRLVEYQAEREARLDGDRRVDRLTTPLSSGRCLPCRDRLLGNPHCQASAPGPCGVVFGPVRDPVCGLGNLVAAGSLNLYGIGLTSGRRMATVPSRRQPCHCPGTTCGTIRATFSIFVHQRGNIGNATDGQSPFHQDWRSRHAHRLCGPGCRCAVPAGPV